MKYLLMVGLLVGCSKEQACDYFKEAPKLLSSVMASKGGCDADMVLVDITKVIMKLPICQESQEGLSVSGINAGKALCTVAGMLGSGIDTAAMLRWKCSEGFNVEEELKKLAKCEL